MRGRMGNQMFKYACARAFQIKMNNQDKIATDFSAYPKGQGSFSENYLLRMKCAENVIEKKYDFKWYQKIVLKFISIYMRITSDPNDKYRIEEFQKKTADFVSLFGLYMYRRGYHNFRIPKKGDIFLSGNYEAHRYFDDIRDELINDFKPCELSDENKRLCEEFDKDELIAVCVRKGDFTSNRRDRLDICMPEYYEKAVDFIRKKRGSDLKVIIFTIDVDWARENLDIDGVSGYLGDKMTPWEQMQVMAKCSHFVICNSTFFWWAQYLSEKNEKIVVAPSYWNGKGAKTDLYINEWILLDPESGEFAG